MADSLRELASCPVCSEIFIEPLILPNCPHTICASCIRKITGDKKDQHDNTFACPVCKVANDPNSLRLDNTAARATDYYRKQKEQEEKQLARAKESGAQETDENCEQSEGQVEKQSGSSENATVGEKVQTARRVRQHAENSTRVFKRSEAAQLVENIFEDAKSIDGFQGVYKVTGKDGYAKFIVVNTYKDSKDAVRSFLKTKYNNLFETKMLKVIEQEYSPTHLLRLGSNVYYQQKASDQYSSEASIACLGQDAHNKLHAITVQHVINKTPGKHKGNNVVLMSMVNGLGTVSTSYVGYYGHNQDHFVDIAAFPISESANSEIKQSDIYNLPTVFGGPNDLLQDTVVQKRGGRTGMTTGRVIDTNYKLVLKGRDGEIKEFNNLIMIKREGEQTSTNKERFAEQGDSGALIYCKESGMPIGIVSLEHRITTVDEDENVKKIYCTLGVNLHRCLDALQQECDLEIVKCKQYTNVITLPEPITYKDVGSIHKQGVFVQTKSIALKEKAFYWNAMKLINGDLWLCSEMGISIYNQHFELVQFVPAGEMGDIYCVAETRFDENVIVGAEKGLFILFCSGKMTKVMIETRCTSLTIVGDFLYAAMHHDAERRDVMVFQINPIAAASHDNQEKTPSLDLELCYSIPLPAYEKDDFITLHATGKVVMACSRDQGCIYFYSTKGTPLHTYNHENCENSLCRPRLCHGDPTASAIIADWATNNIMAISEGKTACLIETFPRVHNLRSVMASSNNLYVLSLQGDMTGQLSLYSFDSTSVYDLEAISSALTHQT